MSPKQQGVGHEKSSFVDYDGSAAFLCVDDYPCSSFCNSSWYSLSSVRLYHMLPYAIVGTLVIEILSVICICGIKTMKERLKTFFVICLGNAISYLLPLSLLSFYGRMTFMVE